MLPKTKTYEYRGCNM